MTKLRFSRADRNSRSLITTAILLAMLMSPAVSQAATNPTTNSPRTYPRASPETIKMVQKMEDARDWQKVALTADNSAYKRISSEIEILVRKGESPTELADRYALKGEDFRNQIKIFRWSYVSYLMQKTALDIPQLNKVKEAMNHNPLPGAYDWVRLHFLLNSLQLIYEPVDPLVQVGRRLLRANRNDEEVMYRFVTVLQLSMKMSEKREAITLAKMYARKNPRNGYWQWQVANAMQAVSINSGSSRFNWTQSEIVEFKKALALLPRSEPRRKDLVRTIIVLEMMFDANGKSRLIKPDELNERLRTTTLH